MMLPDAFTSLGTKFAVPAVPGLIVGIIVAIFTVWLTERTYLRRYSKLIFDGIEQKTQAAQQIWRLRIYNIGKYSAQGVRAELVAIESDGKFRDDAIVSPLNWTHFNTYERNIYPGQSATLDVCSCVDAPNSLRFSNPSVQYMDESSLIRKGTTIAIIVLYQETGLQYICRIQIKWDGEHSNRSGIDIKLLSWQERKPTKNMVSLQ